MPSDIEEEKSMHVRLIDIFEASTVEVDSSELIKRFNDIYDSSSGQGLEEIFEHILKIILSENKRNNDVCRIMYFISELLVNLDNKFKDANAKESMTEIDDIMHPLLKRLFMLLEKWSQASSFTVRYRSCQLLHIILTYIQDHGIGELDMNTYETMLKIIEARKLDVSCNVRIHAILLAKFFQDPSSINDPVIAGLCWQMENDPNPRVRQITVSIVAACEETIIPITKRFLYDKNANVRNAALLHICNRISARSFTTAQRIMILKHCFSDPSPLVRRNAEQRLIPVWFRAYKDKMSRFFKDLREGNESLDNLTFISGLLQVLSKCVKIAQIIDEIGLDVDTCLPKSTLTGEQAFLWRHFYQLAFKDERLAKFIPLPEDLVDFILKYFFGSSIEEDQIYLFNELILFLIDIVNANGVEKCEKIFPEILKIIKNPFISHEVMPYIVPLYLNYAPKEREAIQKDLMDVIEDLLKLLQFTPGQEKSIVLKCFAITSQVLIEEKSTIGNFRDIKEILICNYLDSEDTELRIQSITTLCLYCQLDLIESKLSWPYFAEAVNIGISPLRNTLLKGAFDILRCYGWEIFSDLTNNGEDPFNEALNHLLLHLEDDENERDIVVQGILKLYLAHHTVSPTILSHIIMFLFHPDEYHSSKKDFEEFFQCYGETKEEAECLSKAFLDVINILFDADKNSPFHKISIKKVALELIEYSKGFENPQDFTLEVSFKDLLILKLTKKFLKKPWRLPAFDLHAVCNQFIPANFDQLLQLKEDVKLIIEHLQFDASQQKTPFAKRSIKQFSSYLKKIHVAMNKAPLTQGRKNTASSPLEKKLFTNSYTDESSSNSLREVEIHSVSSAANSDVSSPTNISLSLSDGKLSSSSVYESPLVEKSFLGIQTPLPSSTPARRKTPLTVKAVSRKKPPLSIKTVPEEISFAAKTPRKTTLPVKTPKKRETPLPTKTPKKKETPLPAKTPKKKETPLPVKTPKKRGTPLPVQIPSEDSDFK
ncbi:condensin complex subunit 3 [Trichonephila inaurata madagascariensis]|uniref:Condensin complex subunit 3 n=1 Tax=Trichonephila inaurata madagascariensis TaxID=2747483 RepID=A0A8X6XEM1_9ARAC|nr:condensin complex subunit 3 [Trichonephila inaurata madagascariensis]